MGLGGRKFGELKADGISPSAFLCELIQRDSIDLESHYG